MGSSKNQKSYNLLFIIFLKKRSCILTAKLTNQNTQFGTQKKLESTIGTIIPNGLVLNNDLCIARFLAFNSNSLIGKNSFQQAEMEDLVSGFGLKLLSNIETGPKGINPILKELDLHLTLRTYASGHQLSLADVIIFVNIQRCCKQHIGVEKAVNGKQVNNVKRYINFLKSNHHFAEFCETYFPQANANNNNNNNNNKKNKKNKKDESSEKTDDELDVSEVFGIPQNIIDNMG